MTNSHSPHPLTDKNGRKIYQKPAVSHREILETVAGACAKYPNPVNGKTGSGDNCTIINS